MAERSAAERYHDAKNQRDKTQNRLRELQSFSVFERTSTENAEMGVLADTLAEMNAGLLDLERAMAFAKEDVDIDGYVAQQTEDASDMHGWYSDDLVPAIAGLVAALDRGKMKHAAMERRTYELPEYIRRRLDFPGVGEWLDRLASRLPAEWGQLVVQIAPLTRGQLENVIDVDGGVKPLNPVLIARFQEERQKSWKTA